MVFRKYHCVTAADHAHFRFRIGLLSLGHARFYVLLSILCITYSMYNVIFINWCIRSHKVSSIKQKCHYWWRGSVRPLLADEAAEKAWV